MNLIPTIISISLAASVSFFYLQNQKDEPKTINYRAALSEFEQSALTFAANNKLDANSAKPASYCNNMSDDFAKRLPPGTGWSAEIKGLDCDTAVLGITASTDEDFQTLLSAATASGRSQDAEIDSTLRNIKWSQRLYSRTASDLGFKAKLKNNSISACTTECGVPAASTTSSSATATKSSSNQSGQNQPTWINESNCEGQCGIGQKKRECNITKCTDGDQTFAKGELQTLECETNKQCGTWSEQPCNKLCLVDGEPDPTKSYKCETQNSNGICKKNGRYFKPGIHKSGIACGIKACGKVEVSVCPKSCRKVGEKALQTTYSCGQSDSGYCKYEGKFYGSGIFKETNCNYPLCGNWDWATSIKKCVYNNNQPAVSGICRGDNGCRHPQTDVFFPRGSTATKTLNLPQCGSWSEEPCPNTCLKMGESDPKKSFKCETQSNNRYCEKGGIYYKKGIHESAIACGIKACGNWDWGTSTKECVYNNNQPTVNGICTGDNGCRHPQTDVFFPRGSTATKTLNLPQCGKWGPSNKNESCSICLLEGEKDNKFGRECKGEVCEELGVYYKKGWQWKPCGTKKCSERDDITWTSCKHVVEGPGLPEPDCRVEKQGTQQTLCTGQNCLLKPKSRTCILESCSMSLKIVHGSIYNHVKHPEKRKRVTVYITGENEAPDVHNCAIRTGPTPYYLYIETTFNGAVYGADGKGGKGVRPYFDPDEEGKLKYSQKSSMNGEDGGPAICVEGGNLKKVGPYISGGGGGGGAGGGACLRTWSLFSGYSYECLEGGDGSDGNKFMDYEGKKGIPFNENFSSGKGGKSGGAYWGIEPEGGERAKEYSSIWSPLTKTYSGDPGLPGKNGPKCLIPNFVNEYTIEGC